MATAEDQVPIHAPELLTRRRRAGDTMATGVMWILYMYLWVPLISLGAWLLGFEFAYDAMVRAGGASGLREVLWWYGVIVALIVGAVASWSLSNRRRFRRRNRRRASDVIGDEQLMECFGVSSADLECLRSGRVVEVTLGERGELTRVRASTEPAAGSGSG